MFKITRFKLYFYPLLVLVLGVAVSFYIFQLLATDFQARRETAFKYQARLHAESLRQRLARDLELLEALRDFQVTRENIDPAEFKQYVDKLIDKPREIQAMFWIPRLSPRDLKYLPASLIGQEKDFISQKDWRAEAGAEEQVMPVIYAVSGHQGDTLALNWRGKNIAKNHLFRDTLDRMLKARDPVSTEAFPLSDDGRELGIFFVRLNPVKTSLYTGEQETVRTSGSFVAMLVNINHWVREALSKFDPRDIRLFIFNESNRLVDSRGVKTKLQKIQAKEGVPLDKLKKHFGDRVHFSSSLQLPGRKWKLVIYPGPDFPFTDYSREAWISLAGGLLVTLIATGFLFFLLKWTRENEKRATIDHLTGLYNRRKFFAELDREAERARRYEHPLSLLILDLDDFKEINDTYGHPTGDRVLEKLGELISKNTRDTDLPARYGGEEFAILFPETGLDEAEKIARRIKSQFAGVTFYAENEVKFSLTCSIGLATDQSGKSNMNLLVAKADEALYRAKNTGKNRIETADPV